MHVPFFTRPEKTLQVLNLAPSESWIEKLTEIHPMRQIFWAAVQLTLTVKKPGKKSEKLGFWGLVLLGIRRAVFSNESGVGNAPMYHGQSETKEPIHEGLVAALGPLLDTVLVCSITGIIIIISGAYLGQDLNGIVLTLEAFDRLFFGIGDQLLLLMVLVFGISTLFTYSYYGVKCLDFLTQKKWGYIYNYIYLGSIILSAVATVDVVIGIIDLSFALMCIPNMIAILYLSPKVKERILSLQNQEKA